MGFPLFSLLCSSLPPSFPLSFPLFSPRFPSLFPSLHPSFPLFSPLFPLFSPQRADNVTRTRKKKGRKFFPETPKNRVISKPRTKKVATVGFEPPVTQKESGG